MRDPRGIGCTIENLDAAITAAILGTSESINHIIFGVIPDPDQGWHGIKDSIIGIYAT